MLDTTATTLEGAERRPPLTKPIIILVCSPKGGCGKSTLARAMLVRASQMGYRAHGVDLDKQRTLAKWYAKRPEEGRDNVSVEAIDFFQWSGRMFDLNKAVDAHGRLHSEIVIIDTPPGVEMAMGTFRSMIEAASVVLIPTQPSSDDIESVEPWMRAVRQINPRASFVLSRINKSAKSAVEAQARLMKIGPLCPMSIPDSEDVKRAHEVGCTVLDLSGLRTDVATRFESVWDYLAHEVIA